MTAYRIGDPQGAFPVFSDGGARLMAGRWHQKGDGVVYCAEHYATALLEKLVHANGILPLNQHYVDITIPAGVTYEVFNPQKHSGWDDPQSRVAQAFGHRWCAEGRSAILLVPSSVAQVERNVLINVDHPDAGRIEAGLEIPVHWDRRFFTASRMKE